MPEAHLEANLEQFFRKQTRLVGGRVFKFTSSETGVPDRIVIFPGGRVHFVELKTETGTVDPKQRVIHDQLRALGANIDVVVGRAGVMSWLRRAVEAAYPAKRRGRPPKDG